METPEQHPIDSTHPEEFRMYPEKIHDVTLCLLLLMGLALSIR